MPYKAELTLFIVLAVIATLFFLFLFLYPPIKKSFYKHHTVRAYYKKVARIAEDNDFYLINNFKSHTTDSLTFHIDHLLVGDKYIYCIRDRYYDGALSAKEEDESWIYYQGKNAKYIDNPMRMNELRVEKLALMSGIKRDIFVSIVLINDDCWITPLSNTVSRSYLSSLAMLPKIIKTLESDDVPPLDQWAVERVVSDFATLKNNEN